MTRGQPDTKLIRRHLAALREALLLLERHVGRTAEQLRSDPELRWIVERGLQLCVQNALDVATHLTTAAGLDAQDYATAVDRLAELSILPPDFAARLRKIAGFRNVLVHGYLQVDAGILESALKEGRSELSDFADHIEKHLERIEKE